MPPPNLLTNPAEAIISEKLMAKAPKIRGATYKKSIA